MENKNIIDARGLSCPQPVIMTKVALTSKEPYYKVIVDNGTAKENVSRFAANAGYQVAVSIEGDDYHLILSK